MIVHGWTEELATPWVKLIASNLMRHRGGCVYCMDYSAYSKVANYGTLVSQFANISAVLLKKLRQIGNYDRQFVFAFSFGSRVAVDVALKVGNQAISRMDLCDPAGKCYNFTNESFRQISTQVQDSVIPPILLLPRKMFNA